MWKLLVPMFVMAVQLAYTNILIDTLNCEVTENASSWYCKR